MSSLLEIRDLAVSFGSLRAVDGVSLALHSGRTLAVVGESGSGKSVTALSILRLLPPPPRASIDSGQILFQGRDLLSLSSREMLRVRGGKIAMIFQEPMTALNPVLTIGEQIMEVISRHLGLSRRAARSAACDALNEVGINGMERLDAYPHQFSGGMRQRVVIAMAIAGEPEILLADEPTTALDVSTQARVLDLLQGLQQQRGLAMLLITHDLGLAARRAHDVCVMQTGRIVERGPAERVFAQPQHPYTRALLECRPSIRHRVERLRTIPLSVAANPGVRQISQPRERIWREVAPGHGYESSDSASVAGEMIVTPH